MNSWLETMLSAFRGSRRPASRGFRVGRKTQRRHPSALEQLEERTLLTVPVVSAGADVMIREAGELATIGSFADPDADIWTASVDYGDDSGVGPLALNPDKSFSLGHTYADNGEFTVTVTVSDQDGGVGSDSLLVRVENVPPTEVLTNDGPVDEGKPVTISFNNPDDPSDADRAAGFHYAFSCEGEDLSAATYAGSGTESTKTCTFEDGNDVKTVRARIIDKDDGFTEATTEVVVKDVAPTIQINGPGTVDEGSVYTISLEGLDPGTDTIDSWIIHWGDQADPFNTEMVRGNPTTANHVYLNGPNTYTISAKARNDDGEFPARDPFRVDVLNVAPFALDLKLESDVIDENGRARLSGSFADPGFDNHFVRITWGDGETTDILLTRVPVEQRTFFSEHKYGDDNPTATPSDRYTITVDLIDDGGVITTGSVDLTVNNRFPEVTSLDPMVINEGDPFTLAMELTDIGTQDTYTARIDWGDNQTDMGTIGEFVGSLVPRAPVTGTHAYSDNGTYTVLVCVTDDDTGEGCGSVTVEVNNVQPRLSELSDIAISEGNTIDIAGSFTDSGMDSWTATVDYGDGLGVGVLPLTDKTFNLSHRYARSGEFTVTVTVTDDDGGSHSDSFFVRAANVPPTVDVGPDVVIRKGEILNELGRFVDPGANFWTLTVDYGDGSGAQPLLAGPNKAFNLFHFYRNSGEFTVTVTVSDQDGGAGSDGLIVRVNEDPEDDPIGGVFQFEERIDPTLFGESPTGVPEGLSATVRVTDFYSYGVFGQCCLSVDRDREEFFVGNSFSVEPVPPPSTNGLPLAGYDIRVSVELHDPYGYVPIPLSVRYCVVCDPDRPPLRGVVEHPVFNYSAPMTGQAFEDLNGDGERSVDEPPIASTRLFETGNPATNTSTDMSGNYNFLTYSNFRYQSIPLRADVGDMALYPTVDTSYYHFSGEGAEGRQLGVFKLDLRGVVFDDQNGDGIQNNGESVLPNVGVFLDTDDNGLFDFNNIDSPLDLVRPIGSFPSFLTSDGEPSDISDDDGLFKLGSNALGPPNNTLANSVIRLNPRGVHLRTEFAQDFNSGFVQTSGLETLHLTSGASLHVPIGLARASRVSGKVFNDLNGNGIQEPGESPRPDVYVYLDTDDDGIRDPEFSLACNGSVVEPCTRTDDDGNYTLPNVGIGTVRADAGFIPSSLATATLDPNTRYTTMLNETLTDVNFGIFENILVSGQVFDDKNGDGIQNDHRVEPGVVDAEIHLDLKNDGSVDRIIGSGPGGLFLFFRVPPGTHRLTQVLPPGFESTAPCGDEHVFDVNQSGGQIEGLNFGRRMIGGARSAVASQAVASAGGMIAGATQCRLPDIAVTRATRAGGNRIAFDFTTRGLTEVFQVGLFRSADDVLDASDVAVVGVTQVTPPPNGTAQQGSLILSRNFQADPQRPRIIVVADPNQSIDELVESNNTAVVEVTADIAITSAKRETTSLRGSPQMVTVTYELSNNPGAFNLGLYRSRTSAFDAADAELLPNSLRKITPIAGATSGQEVFNIGAYTADPARPFLIVVADPNKQVEESLESNNVSRIERIFDTSPLAFAGDFLYNEPRDYFQAFGMIQIGFAPDGNNSLIPVATVNGNVIYNDDEFLATGIVSAVVGNRLERLFNGTLEVDLPDAVSIKLERTQSNLDFSLAGNIFNYSRVAFVKNAAGQGQLELQGRVLLPVGTFNGVELKFEGANSVRLGPDAVQLAGGRIAFPNVEFDLKGLKVEATDMAIEYLPSPPVEPSQPLQDALRIQGKLNLDFEKFFKTVVNPGLPPQQSVNAGFFKIATDFAGDNYIEIKRDAVNVVGSVSWDNAAVPIIPGVLVLRKGKCTFNNVEKDYRCEVGVKLPLIHPDLVFLGGFGIKNGDPNFVLVGVENVNLPVAALPGVFFQKVTVFGDNLANPSPAAQEVGATVGFTFGPQYSVPVIPFVTEMPFNAVSLVNLEATGKISRQHLVVSGDLKLVHEDVAAISGECDFVFSDSTKTPPTAWMVKCKGSANIFKTAVVGSGVLTIDSKTNTLVSKGAGQLQLPKVGGTLLRGQKIADGQFYVQIKVNDTNIDDFGLIYATFDLPIFGSQTIGLKVSFDGGFEFFTDMVEIRDQLPRSASALARSADGFPRAAVPPGTSRLLLTAEWDNDIGPVAVELVAPDGTVIPESAFDGINIGVIPELSDGTLKSVGLRNPAPGEWLIRVVNSDGLGEVVYKAFIPAAAPTIEMNSASVFANNATVNYTAADPDSTAKVSLFYDNDGEGFDGVFIADGLAETDGPGDSEFDVSSLPDGAYHLYAMIDDGNNAPVFDYLETPVTVDNTAPTVLSATLATDATRRNVAAINVAFDEAIAATGASDPANYLVRTPGRDKRFGTADDVTVRLRSSTLDAATNSVRLVPMTAPKLNQFFQINVLAKTGSNELTDMAGNALPADAAPGVAFSTIVGLGTKLSFVEPDGDTVSLSLTRGGLMQLTADATGVRLRLDGTTDASTLTGSVKRPRRGGGNGTTTIESITAPTAFVNRLPATITVNEPIQPVLAAVIDEVLLERV